MKQSRTTGLSERSDPCHAAAAVTRMSSGTETKVVARHPMASAHEAPASKKKRRRSLGTSAPQNAQSRPQKRKHWPATRQASYTCGRATVNGVGLARPKTAIARTEIQTGCRMRARLARLQINAAPANSLPIMKKVVALVEGGVPEPEREVRIGERIRRRQQLFRRELYDVQMTVTKPFAHAVVVRELLR